MTGLTTEQVLFVLSGRGANGKSVLLETIAYMLGDYAANVPFSLFEANARATISNDVALLVGRRFVTASETTDTIRLNEARIKALTGQDTTTARQMYRDFFSFQPMAKFWLSTNHLPAVRDRSHGFWRRMRIVPFDAQFAGQTRDKGLGDKRRAEASGILLWALDGCARWFREGLGDPPQCVGEATSQFEHESDRLGDFLDAAAPCGRTHRSARVNSGNRIGRGPTSNSSGHQLVCRSRTSGRRSRRALTECGRIEGKSIAA